MIGNPNRVVLEEALRQEAIEDGDKDASALRSVVRVKSFKYNPDAEVDKMVQIVSGDLTEVDAVLMERAHRGAPYKQVHYPTFRDFMESRQVRKRILSHVEGRDLRTLNEQLRERVAHDGRKGVQRALARRLRETNNTTGSGRSNYDMGLYPDEFNTLGYGQRSVFPIQDTVLPTLNSPHAKQQLFMDYLDMHRKSWEAATRNPIGKRICLAGNTLIPLLDGRNVSLTDLAKAGEPVWVYACRDGLVFPAEATAHFTGVRQVYAVTLDNGEVIEATSDHPFMLRDGSYREVKDLRAGDSLMPLYRKHVKSNSGKPYEQVWHPDMALWEYTHRMVGRVTQRGKFLLKPFGREGGSIHLHHIDHDSLNNTPSNLTFMSQREHVTLTSKLERNKDIKRKLPQSVNFGNAIKKLWADPEWRARQQAKFKGAATPEHREKLSANAKQNWQEKRDVYLQGIASRERSTQDPETGRFVKKAKNNHKVVSVEPRGETAVFDLHVPGFHNFAISAGVFVHNCDLIPQFVLGRGLVCTVDNAKHQLAWDQHWQKNRMRWRIRQILKELLIYGEIFLRYFDTRDGLLIRSLDPSTIWDIITDPDDIEAVEFYHQQYTMLNMSPVPGYISRVPSQLIIRQIPGTQIDHFKINSTSSEKRGRSQLYTILGWLLRFKEYANDRVLQNKMRAMFSLDVTVKSGDPADMLTVEELFNQPPAPGSVLIHNDAVELEFKNANVSANDAKTDGEMLLKIIALGSGVSEAFLGVSSNSTRAGALIQTEPDVKNFETYQEIVEDVLGASYERLRVKHKLEPTKSRFEVTFPALAQEDRSAKLKDIAMAESMDYFSKARAASMAAKEFGVTGYNFAIEQQQIMEERATTPMMAKGMEQMPKITQDPATGGGLTDGGPPGTPGPVPNPAKGENEGVTQTSGEMGFSATNLSGRGMANTQATLDRGGFTRGGEKNSIKTSTSAGAPLRASTEPAVRNVWNDRARAAALASRRANRARRDALKEPPKE